MEYKRLYIAYGSNLNLSQMQQRCPHSKTIQTAMLEDYELQFRSVATIVPKKGAQVPILIWEIDGRDEHSLDRYEGFPNLYRKELFEMKIGGRKKECMAYLMNAGHESPPSPSYLATIKHGYEQNGLDTSYLYDAVQRAMEAPKIQIDTFREDEPEAICDKLDEDWVDPFQLAFSGGNL